jgi:hypothetical protein
MSDPKWEFEFRGGGVGYFETETFPREPGVYPYMPYRSRSHYQMFEALAESGFAECTGVSEHGGVRFKVIGSPGYGRLELSDFQRV